VALNCVSNGKLLRSGIFDDIWIQPAAGDAGAAQGAALYSWHHILKNPRHADNEHDFVRGSQLGPSFSRDQIRAFLDENHLPYQELEMPERNQSIAKAIVDEKVIGLFQGRMEFGPRALGNRSILADARSPKMQSFLNLATKFRESFRPFAPIVLQEDAHEYFEEITKSPYMLMVDQVRPERCLASTVEHRPSDMREWVNEPRSDVPAITHVDYSARIQTVDQEQSPNLYGILQEFKNLTGYSVLVNTSFNVRSEPIVCTPEDAYVCFMRTGIDLLVLDNFLLQKSEQPEWQEEEDWRENFAID